MTLYTDLGVPEDASPEDIKRAHRQSVHRHHPDKGGDRDAFERVQRAYLVLSDPERRSKYDRTGDTAAEPDNELAKLAHVVVTAFDRSLAQGNVEQRDIVVAMEQHILSKINEGRRANHSLRDTIKTLESVQRRLKFTGDGTNILDSTLTGRIAEAWQNIVQNEATIVLHETALNHVAQYGYDFDQRPTPPQYFQFTGTTTA